MKLLEAFSHRLKFFWSVSIQLFFPFSLFPFLNFISYFMLCFSNSWTLSQNARKFKTREHYSNLWTSFQSANISQLLRIFSKFVTPFQITWTFYLDFFLNSWLFFKFTNIFHIFLFKFHEDFVNIFWIREFVSHDLFWNHEHFLKFFNIFLLMHIF